MSDTALGIDIGSHSVKAVLLRRRRGHVQMLRAASAPLEELGHMEDSRRKISKVAMIVRNLLRTAGMRAIPAQTAVAGKRSIIRFTRVPPAPAWRLKMLVDYEIEGDTEGKGKDLAYDFLLLDLPTSQLEFTVMMAMARTDLVEHHCEILGEAGVPLANVSLTPFAVFNTYIQNRTEGIADDKTVLLVDIGGENLNLVVQRNGNLFFARNVSPGGRAFTEAVQDEFRLPFAEAEQLKCSKGRLLLGRESQSSDETQVSPGADAPTEVSGLSEGEAPGLLGETGPELGVTDADQTAQLSEAMLPVAGRVASAIQSSLMYCRAQTRLTDLEVDEMVLTGGGTKLPGLRQVLGRRLGIPVVPADPLKGIDLSPLRREAREEVEADAESYATAVGLALSDLRPDAVSFNLLPQKIKQRRRFFARTVYLWLAGAAMLAMMVLVGYSSVKHTGALKGHVEEIDAKLQANTSARSRLDDLLRVNRQYAAEVAVMRDELLSLKQLSSAFGALTRHTPPEIELTQFRVAGLKDGKFDEVFVKGFVLRRVKDRSGKERRLEKDDAHPIIEKLRSDLVTHPAFATPENTPVIHKVKSEPDPQHVAEFELRLVLPKVANDTALGTE